jgi:MYXO-CTERM domain-containing protein
MKALAIPLVFLSQAAAAATLMVGPGQPYALPCDAIAAANPGDTILVDAAGNGSYDGDHCNWTTDNLTISGVNGLASINAGGTPSVTASESNIDSDKGIFVIYANNATVENFELSGAVSDPGSLNGAGIRHQGTNLTVRNCYFHDNEDGILGAPPDAGSGTVLIEFSEFFHNGAGDGESHNMYLGDYGLFTLQYSHSHCSVIGHLVKSRAWETHIQYNLLADDTGCTPSYEVDVPQGGLTYVVGNSIEQSETGAENGNSTIVSYAEESTINPTQELFLVNNTIVNDAQSGTFLNAVGSPPLTLVNNLYHGAGTTPPGGTSNWIDSQGNPLLEDPTDYNYLLLPGSPCIDAGTNPGTGAGEPLQPVAQYLPDAGAETRDNAHWDIGAFEFDDQGAGIADDGGVTGSSSGSSGASTASSSSTTSGGSSTGGVTSASTSTSASSSTSSGGSNSVKGSTSNSSGSAASSNSSGGAPDGGIASPSGGCGCGSNASPSALWALILVLALWRRRIATRGWPSRHDLVARKL